METKSIEVFFVADKYAYDDSGRETDLGSFFSFEEALEKCQKAAKEYEMETGEKFEYSSMVEGFESYSRLIRIRRGTIPVIMDF